VLKLLAVPTLAAGLAGWFAFDSGQLRGNQVEVALKQQMNGSRAGAVTRVVHCSGRKTLSCVLTSTRGTTIRARVHVDGGGWRADWAPLSG
jgi:hypothetical protein